MRYWLMLAGLLCLSCAQRPHEHAAYLWSLSQSADYREALQPRPAQLTQLRVLVLEIEPDGALKWAKLPPANLLSAWVPVVRMDGRAPVVPAESLAKQLRLRLASMPPALAIEFDHDVASARLLEYRDWIQAFRAAWPTSLPESRPKSLPESRPALPSIQITALPDWLRYREFDQLQDVVSAISLQVHAVDDPKLGLLDVRQALAWSASMQQRSRIPYWIALPTYRAIIAGRVHWPDPRVLHDLETQIRAQAGARFQGIAWFRVPTDRERNALSAGTFRSLLAGEVQIPDAAPQLVARGKRRYDLWLRNDTVWSAKLPTHLRLRGRCQAEGASGYRRVPQSDPDAVAFQLAFNEFLPPQRRRRIAWLVCTQTPEFYR